MNSMACKFAISLGILLGGSLVALADHETWPLGKEAPMVMTGCIAKDFADIIVGEAKTTGSGLGPWQMGVSQGVCGTTRGMSRFVEAYEEYRDESTNHKVLWYVKYEMKLDDGSWKPYWGFTILSVKVGVPNVSFTCDSEASIKGWHEIGYECI